MINKFWEKAVAFHGHACPGLAIGVRVSQVAIEVMNISADVDEELLCITENDACGVDGIQAILSCTLGKGNLIFKNRGKQAFTFVKRSTGKAYRFYLIASKEGKSREEYQNYLLHGPAEKVFSWSEVDLFIPEKARIFASVDCDKCHEKTADYFIRLHGEQKLCLDCFNEYSRGW